MKIKLLTITAVLIPQLVFPQIPEETSVIINQQERDTTEFVSIEDIIKEKEEMTSQTSLINHYNNVWSRNKYFNISYNSSTLSPQGVYDNGLGIAEPVKDFKSNIGISLQQGKSYRLHKKPLWNLLHFYIDYSPLDLSFNHYKGKGDGNLYDSSKKFTDEEDNKNYFYMPWNLEKYEFSYGMTLGPSITIAPFTHLKKANGLHFLKINLYYHIGYQGSILYIVNNEDADMNPQKTYVYDSNTENNNNDLYYMYNSMEDNLKMNWGHGLMTSFGVSMTWKNIGIGYEHRTVNNRFKSFIPSEFGSNTYKFKTTTNRIYISFRMGR